MISVDSNILLYAQDARCPEHAASRRFVLAQAENADFAISELVLVELYVLLRNPAVLERPLGADAAVQVIEAYRKNPRWRILEGADGVMTEVWRLAAAKDFPRRKIFDARVALTLRRLGVTRFATRNVEHFGDFGFETVWDPVSAGA